MSHRVHKRARRAARAAVVTATSLPAIFVCAGAIAQQAPPNSQSQTPPATGDRQEAVVTGFRASLESALEAKRKAIQPIDSAAPEDTDKMPDQNVPEVLHRLPGIPINRA